MSERDYRLDEGVKVARRMNWLMGEDQWPDAPSPLDVFDATPELAPEPHTGLGVGLVAVASVLAGIAVLVLAGLGFAWLAGWLA